MTTKEHHPCPRIVNCCDFMARYKCVDHTMHNQSLPIGYEPIHPFIYQSTACMSVDGCMHPSIHTSIHPSTHPSTDRPTVGNQRRRPLTGSRYDITHISARIYDSNETPKAMPMFSESENMVLYSGSYNTLCLTCVNCTHVACST